MTTIGSLFTGYGGLDMGVAMAVDSDARVAWTSDVEPGPCKLAATRWPGTAVWAIEGDMIVAPPGRLRVSNRTATDFRAWYSHPGERISEEDLDDDN